MGYETSITLKDEDSFIKSVSHFFDNKDLSDVVLTVGQQKYFAHKFILAKSSQVFRTMLCEKHWQQTAESEIDLKEDEECQKHFDKFLRFFYTAEVRISTDSVVGVLRLADKYDVEPLINLCTEYMVKNIKSSDVCNALNWYFWANTLHLDKLLVSCRNAVSWNMEELISLPQWLDIDIDFVMDTLGSPQLVISNEYVLYKAVERWLLHDDRLHALGENSKKLLPLVRFPQMLVPQLYQVEKGDLASKDGSKDLLEKLLKEAYRFRSLCPFQGELQISFNTEFYRPRNYKDLSVFAVYTCMLDDFLVIGGNKFKVCVRTSVDPVPSLKRQGNCTLKYHKSKSGKWTIQVNCCERDMVNPKTKIQAVVVVFDDADHVLLVQESQETTVCSQNTITMTTTVLGNGASLINVLSKVLPN